MFQKYVIILCYYVLIHNIRLLVFYLLLKVLNSDKHGIETIGFIIKYLLFLVLKHFLGTLKVL